MKCRIAWLTCLLLLPFRIPILRAEQDLAEYALSKVGLCWGGRHRSTHLHNAFQAQISSGMPSGMSHKLSFWPLYSRTSERLPMVRAIICHTFVVNDWFGL